MSKFEHNDCRGITKRDMVGNESRAPELRPCDDVGSVEDVELDRSVVVRMASSGTWCMTFGPERC